MNTKTMLICLLVMSILGGTIGMSGVIRRMKTNSLENDKSQIAASDNLYYNNTGIVACFNEDISLSDDIQITKIYKGLVDLYGDESYVRETFKEVNVNTLISNRYLSSLSNSDKKFVTNVECLDVVLVDTDFEEDKDLGWVVSLTATPVINLASLQEGAWDEIDLDVKEVRHNEDGIIVSGKGISTNDNVFFYSEGSVPGTVNKNTQLSVTELDTVNYFNNTSLSGFITQDNWTMRRR